MVIQDGNVVDYSESLERDANWYLNFKAANHDIFNNPINREENTDNGHIASEIPEFLHYEGFKVSGISGI